MNKATTHPVKRAETCLYPVPLRGVRPTGWPEDYLRRQAAGFTGNPEGMGFPFASPRWGSRELIYPDPHRPNRWIPYEVTGYWLDGAVKTACLLGDDALGRKAYAEVEFILASAAADTWAEDACDFRDHHSYYFPGSMQTKRTAPDGSPLATYQSRSAIRGDAMGGAEKSVDAGFVNVIRNGRPNMCSEFAWMANNPLRSESPLFVRAQAAVAGMKALTEFAQHHADVWLAEEVLQWPYNTPAILGQMPVAAAIFRQRGISEGEVLAAMRVNTRDALSFQPIPLKLSTRHNFNAQLGAAGRTGGAEGGAIADPALYFALGKVTLDVGDVPTKHEIEPLDAYNDPVNQVLRPSNGEIEWDMGRGLYRLQSRRVNGVVGFLNVAPKHDLPDVVIETPMEFGAIALASLDGKPIAESGKMLLQVMSQQRNSGWTEEAPDAKRHRALLSRGGAPIQIKNFAGTVSFKRSDAAELQATPLHPNFAAAGAPQPATGIGLEPHTMYYLIERK